MGIHKLSETVHKLWNGWEIRMVVLLSLFLQIFLIVFGSRRKYTAGFWLGTFVWLAYLSADWVATFSLGILATRLGDSETNCINRYPGLIPAFWAPVLLAHLGGTDTLTAYSMEDNELWSRHLLQLVCQVAMAFYAFSRSWWSKDPLLFVAIPVFLVGLIKYGGRNWVLRSASSGQLRSPANRLVNELRQQSYLIIGRLQLNLGDIIPEAKFLHEANLFFQLFRLQFADEDDLSTYGFLCEKTATEAFKLIEVEMGFIYDVLYTKMNRVCSSHIILRAINFSCIASALLAFLLGMSKNNHAYLPTDITISYFLLVGAIIIEIYSVVLLLFSDWAMLWLSGKMTPLFNFVYRTISSSFLYNDKRWTRSMGQQNLISSHLSKRKSIMISTQKLLGKSHIQRREDVSTDLKELIFKQLLDKCERCRGNLREILSERGDQVIGREGCYETFKWSVKLADYNESLLKWHIATDICYHDDIRKNGGDANNVHPNSKMSILLSNYMVYLMCDWPILLPKEIDNQKYTRTCKDVSKFSEKIVGIISFKIDFRNSPELFRNREQLPSDVSELYDGFKLANLLQSHGWDNERKWEMISKVWVEMLTYAASHCGWKEHTRTLTRGGELLTHVCLLMAHLGLSEKCSKTLTYI